MSSDKRWLAPLTGVAFVVLAVVGAAISGDIPDPTEDSTQQIVEFYTDKKDSQIASAMLIGLAASMLVFFGGTLRRALADADARRGILPALALAGAAILATGMAIDSMITFALADSAGEVDPSTTEALSTLWNYDFMPMAVGVQVFFLATGLSIVRHGAFPKWLGWIAILLAVIAVTPIGWGAFLGGAVVILILSVMLTLRWRREGAGHGAPPPQPAA